MTPSWPLRPKWASEMSRGSPFSSLDLDIIAEATAVSLLERAAANTACDVAEVLEGQPLKKTEFVQNHLSRVSTLNSTSTSGQSLCSDYY